MTLPSSAPAALGCWSVKLTVLGVGSSSDAVGGPAQSVHRVPDCHQRTSPEHGVCMAAAWPSWRAARINGNGSLQPTAVVERVLRADGLGLAASVRASSG